MHSRDVPVNSKGKGLFNYDTHTLKLSVLHGKTDRMGVKENFKVAFIIPDGLLLKLWLAHVTEGRNRLVYSLPDDEQHSKMFMSGATLPFSSSTLTQWWKVTMNNTANIHELEYFRPSLGRKSFSEDYFEKHGHSSDLMYGASAIMGNSEEQLRVTYTPTRKSKAAQKAALATANGV